jgi:hypothetical protein
VIPGRVFLRTYLLEAVASAVWEKYAILVASYRQLGYNLAHATHSEAFSKAALQVLRFRAALFLFLRF